MKRTVSLLLATVMCFTLLFAVTVPSVAEEDTVPAAFYVLKKGLPFAVGSADKPDTRYIFAGYGKIKLPTGSTDKRYVDFDRGLNEYIVMRPDTIGGKAFWYTIKKEGAIWRVEGAKEPSVTVVYDRNGDDVRGKTTDSGLYSKDDRVTACKNGYSRNGYTFTGWNTARDGSGRAFNPGDRITPLSDFYDASKQFSVIHLYAQWKSLSGESETEKPDGTEGTEGTEVPDIPETPELPEIPELPEEEITGETVNLGIRTPRRMSVRFENGKIYKTGDTLEIKIGKDYKFQMCSNNWDNDTYDDDGNGISGTVVYTVRVSSSFTERSYNPSTKTFVLPKGDPVLRTDVNKCFMAYRYHFKQDYDKQTGIEKVVNTPLESLSVNLPLGSTIKSDAYISHEKVDTAFVFIENDADLTRSYTDFNWNR